MSTKVPQYASFNDNPWPPGGVEDLLQELQPIGYVPWAERWPQDAVPAPDRKVRPGDDDGGGGGGRPSSMAAPPMLAFPARN